MSKLINKVRKGQVGILSNICNPASELDIKILLVGNYTVKKLDKHGITSTTVSAIIIGPETHVALFSDDNFQGSLENIFNDTDYVKFIDCSKFKRVKFVSLQIDTMSSEAYAQIQNLKRKLENQEQALLKKENELNNQASGKYFTNDQKQFVVSQEDDLIKCNRVRQEKEAELAKIYSVTQEQQADMAKFGVMKKDYENDMAKYQKLRNEQEQEIEKQKQILAKLSDDQYKKQIEETTRLEKIREEQNMIKRLATEHDDRYNEKLRKLQADADRVEKDRLAQFEDQLNQNKYRNEQAEKDKARDKEIKNELVRIQNIKQEQEEASRLLKEQELKNQQKLENLNKDKQEQQQALILLAEQQKKETEKQKLLKEQEDQKEKVRQEQIMQDQLRINKEKELLLQQQKEAELKNAQEKAKLDQAKAELQKQEQLRQEEAKALVIKQEELAKQQAIAMQNADQAKLEQIKQMQLIEQQKAELLRQEQQKAEELRQQQLIQEQQRLEEHKKAMEQLAAAKRQQEEAEAIRQQQLVEENARRETEEKQRQEEARKQAELLAAQKEAELQKQKALEAEAKKVADEQAKLAKEKADAEAKHARGLAYNDEFSKRRGAILTMSLGEVLKQVREGEAVFVAEGKFWLAGQLYDPVSKIYNEKLVSVFTKGLEMPNDAITGVYIGPHTTVTATMHDWGFVPASVENKGDAVKYASCAEFGLCQNISAWQLNRHNPRIETFESIEHFECNSNDFISPIKKFIRETINFHWIIFVLFVIIVIAVLLMKRYNFKF
jgi:hypothetical protein